jgi:chromosome segregation ATPase
MFSEDDKQWLTGELGKTNSRLDGLKEEFGQLRDEVGQLRDEFVQLNARVGALESKVDLLRSQYEALDAKVERVETNLLTEFHKWASPNEARQRTHTATLRAIDLEMEHLSERIDKLEQRPS